MARQRQNGGRKEPFPRHISNGLLDLKDLWWDIERAEAIAEDTSQHEEARQYARQYRDLLQEGMLVRINWLLHDAESHDQAISGQTVELCRQYCKTEPSRRQVIDAATVALGMKAVRGATNANATAAATAVAQ